MKAQGPQAGLQALQDVKLADYAFLKDVDDIPGVLCWSMKHTRIYETYSYIAILPEYRSIFDSPYTWILVTMECVYSWVRDVHV